MAEKLPKSLVEELDTLMRRLRDSRPEERAGAMRRLQEFERHGKISLPLLLEMAGEDDVTTAMYAITALGRNGEPAAVKKLAELVERYRESNPLMLDTLVDALGETRSGEAVPCLLGLIGIQATWKGKLLGKLSRKGRKDAPDAEEQRFRQHMTLPVLRALEQIGDGRAAELVADYLEHRDALVRCHVIRLLMNARYREQNERLRELARNDPNEVVREQADIALARLDPIPPAMNN